VSTFVSVGNATQPFARLLEAVCELAPRLPQPVFVQFGSARTFRCPSCSGAAFVEMAEFERRVGEAELLILHAGAGSVIHAVRAGKMPVVMPRLASLGEHVDDHQLEFARQLEKTGKVLVAHDASTLAQAAVAALQQQGTSDRTSYAEPPLVGMVRELIVRRLQDLNRE
jgi:beta-1,4-N-acetylglucosaminyltransferase